MFDDIGDKLKGLATFITWAGILASVIGGLVICVQDGAGWILVGLGVAVGGSLLSWVSSFILYAIGDIAENAEIVAECAVDQYNLLLEQGESNGLASRKPSKNENKTPDWDVNLFCPKCSARLTVSKEILKTNDTFYCVSCNHMFVLDGQTRKRLIDKSFTEIIS